MTELIDRTRKFVDVKHERWRSGSVNLNVNPTVDIDGVGVRP